MSLSGIGAGSAASAGWSALGASRAMRPQPPSKEDLFQKVDSDGSGGVDATELGSMLGAMAQKSGQSVGDASERFSQFDTDGSGSLSVDELDSGMKSLMPAPASTMDFAARRSGDGAGSGEAAEALDALVQQLDGDGDGSLSASELDAGRDTLSQLQGPPPGPPPGGMPPGPPPTGASGSEDADDTLQSLLKAADTDDDGSLSSTELDTLKDTLDSARDALSTSSSDDGTSGASGPSGAPVDFQALAQKVLEQYAQSAATATQSSLSLSA